MIVYVERHECTKVAPALDEEKASSRTTRAEKRHLLSIIGAQKWAGLEKKASLSLG
jgi:hypothetical protein